MNNPVEHAIRFGVSLLFVLVAIRSDAAVHTLRVAPEAQQEIEAWGLTTTPIDWDGRSMLRDPDIVSRLYRESGVSVIRLLLGGAAIYDNENQQIQDSAAELYLLPQIRQITEHGLDGYLISILSPPAYMKKYYSTRPFVEGDPNGLRRECEDLFAEFVVDLLRQIDASNTVLPIAISIQSQPDLGTPDFGCPPALAQGTIYTMDQWFRLSAVVRECMDASGFSSIDLIGPESVGTEWARAVLSAPPQGVAGAPLAHVALASSELLDANMISSLDPENSRDSVGQRDLWISSSASASARTDQEVVLRAFERLRIDLIDLRASAWFWRYGFTWDASPESLFWGRSGRETLIFEGLSRIWRSAPPGSVVRRLLETDGSTSVNGFALESAAILTICLFNSDANSQGFSLTGVDQSGCEGWFAADGQPSDLRKIERTDGQFTIDLSPGAVAIVNLFKE